MTIFGLPYTVWAPPLLVFARVGALFAASPLVGSFVLPTSLRVLLGILVAWSALASGIPAAPPDASIWPLALITQVLIGLVIGFLASLIFLLFHTAGAALDSELGFTVAQVFNPFSAAGTETLLANWFDAIGTVIFLVLGGAQLLVLAAEQSFRLIPLNVPVVQPGAQFLQGLMSAFIGSFLLAVEVAAPIMMALLLVDLIGAVLGRLLPQLNVLTFNIPLKMWLGLGLVAIALPTLTDAGRLGMTLLQQAISQTLNGFVH